MSENLKWKVVRRHEGDRTYEEGDTRIGTRQALGHLEPKVLKEFKPTRNKQKATHDNKGDAGADVAASAAA